ARAATRRGWSRITGPSTSNAGGRRVVFPAPGAAVTTTARERRTEATIGSRDAAVGSGWGGIEGLRNWNVDFGIRDHGCHAAWRPRTRIPHSTFHIPNCEGAAPGSRGHADTHRTGDTGATQPAVPVGILGEVLLMVVFGIVERRRRKDLG